MKYYLAYGSNLSRSQMDFRCPESKLVGTTILKDYVLEFRTAFGGNSFATISKKEGSIVPVAIYEISKNDEKTLDYYEGVNGGHYFKDTATVEIDGKVYECMVYVMNLKAKLKRASDSYISVIRNAYDEYNFDKDILKEAIFNSEV